MVCPPDGKFPRAASMAFSQKVRSAARTRDGKWSRPLQLRENFGEIGLNRFFLMRPVIGAGTEFNFHNRTNVAGFGRGKDAGIMKQKALAIVHVGINFEFPSGPPSAALKRAARAGCKVF